MPDANDQAPPAEPRLPEPLVAALETLERELHSVSLAKLLKRRQINATSAQLALRGIKAYLAGETDQAIQMLETVAEELRDLTVQLPNP